MTHGECQKNGRGRCDARTLMRHMKVRHRVQAARRAAWTAVAGLGLAGFAPAGASMELTGIAARSVHLAYQAPPAAAALVRMKVDQSTPGSYFMACGWNEGYFGIQELPGGRKVAIFSVWDSKEDDPRRTPQDQRVQTLYRHPDVRVGRFGGEGSGGQSFYPLDWKIGDEIQFLVAAFPMGDRTAYAGYLQPPGTHAWIHLVTFSTPSRNHDLRGVHSFVEDFLRNRTSTGIRRSARMGPVWIRQADGAWQEVKAAMFTADDNQSANIDAGVAENSFYLATGGDTRNTGVPLWQMVRLTGSHPPPEGLPELKPPPAPELPAAAPTPAPPEGNK